MELKEAQPTRVASSVDKKLEDPCEGEAPKASMAVWLGNHQASPK